MKRSWIFVSSVLSMLLPFASAMADVTICSTEDSKKFAYGPKAELKLEVPSAKLPQFRDLIQKYSAKSAWHYSAVGFEKSSEGGADYRGFLQILQKEPRLDVSISVRTDDREHGATASVETFSLSCGVTEDWRPHWNAFRTAVSENFQISAERSVPPR